MATTPKVTTVEYVFEGDTLNLAQAIKKTETLLKASAAAFKKYQNGTLTAEQAAQLKSARASLRTMRAVEKKKRQATEEDKQKARIAGRNALSIAKSLHSKRLKAQDNFNKQKKTLEEKQQAEVTKYTSPEQRSLANAAVADMQNSMSRLQQGQLEPEQKAIQQAIQKYNQVMTSADSTDKQRAESVRELQAVYAAYGTTLRKAAAEADKLNKAQAEEIEEREKLLSIAGQENAKQNAELLESYSSQMKDFLSPQAYYELTNAVATYRAVISSTAATEDERYEAIKGINQAYEDYVRTLKNAKLAQTAAEKGIHSFTDLMAQMRRQIELTTQSVSFWIRIFRQAFSVLKEGFERYGDYVEAINFLQNASGEAADEMYRFAKGQAKVFGLDYTATYTSAAMFYSFADSMGFASKEATLLSQNMTKLAQDIASLQNIDISEATTKLRSALAGHSRALAQLGINVNEANVEEWLLSKGVNKSMSTMNEASQAAARYAFILEKSTSAQGDLAKTLQSPANQLKILRMQMKLLGQNLGSLFTGIVIPIVKILNGLLQPINAFFIALTELSSSGFSGAITEGASDLAEDLEAAEKAASHLTGLDEINQATTTSNDVSITGTGLDTDIQKLLGGYDNLAESVGGLTDMFAALGGVLAPIWSLTGNTKGFGLLTGVFKVLGAVLTPITKTLEVLGTWFQALPGWIKTPISLVLELASALLSVGVAMTLFKTLMKSTIFETFTGVIKGMLTTFVNLGTALWTNVIKPFIAWITQLIAAQVESFKTTVATKGLGAALLGVAKSLIAVIASGAKWIISMIAQGIRAYALMVKNLILAGSFWKIALGVIAAAGAGALVVAGIVATATAVGAASQSRADNSVKMAKGGVVTGPTFAMIGEGKHDEAVIPLGNSPQFKSMKEDIAGDIVKSLTNFSIGKQGQAPRANTPVILQLDGRELARVLLPNLGYAQPQTGVRLNR